MAMAAPNFGFLGLRSAGTAPGLSTYSQYSGNGSAPHCFLNWKVPSSGVDRPKSSVVAPEAIANCRICQ